MNEMMRPEPTDDRLRAVARAARTEVEAGLDADAELAAVRERASTFAPEHPSTSGLRGAPRNRTLVVLGTAAAAVLIVGAAIWLSTDDDTITTTAATTLPLSLPATTAPIPATSTPATLSASTVPTTAPATPGACTDIKAHDVGVAGIGALIVEARLAGTAPAIEGCLESIPPEFDGSPGRCWACPGITFAGGPIDVGAAVSEDGSGGSGFFEFQLAVSTPTQDTVVDTTETWRFDLVDGLLVFAGVEFVAPLVSRADSLATITTYLDAIEAGEWLAAASMLDDGAQNPDERPDLRRLGLTDYSYESVAAALEQWCAAGCSTEPPSLADLEFNGWSHDLVRFDERIRVRWYEGMMSIEGLPPQLPNEPVDWRELRWEATRIGHSCVSDSTICTRVIHGPDGTPISLDPNSRVLTRHAWPEVSVTLPDAYGQLPWLYVAGPDDVVYLQVDPAVPAEVAADLVAVSLADGDAGRELGRWSDVVNNVGDSELVATPSGLVNVDCCGPEPLRPAPDAPVLVPWVDRSGAEVASTDPSIGTSVYPDLTVTRSDRVPAGSRSWTIATPADWANRGMPQVTPTFDGGFVAALPTGVDRTIVVRGWPDGEVEQIRLGLPQRDSSPCRSTATVGSSRRRRTVRPRGSVRRSDGPPCGPGVGRCGSGHRHPARPETMSRPSGCAIRWPSATP
jgi:hypothetical protein